MLGDVSLRRVEAGDLSVFFDHQMDPEANRRAAFPARDYDSFMAHWEKILVDRSVITKTILYDGEVVGNIVSWEQSGEREVGYWIGSDYWGKGIATRALAVSWKIYQIARSVLMSLYTITLPSGFSKNVDSQSFAGTKKSPLQTAILPMRLSLG